jgi:hypothetical protein
VDPYDDQAALVVVGRAGRWAFLCVPVRFLMGWRGTAGAARSRAAGGAATSPAATSVIVNFTINDTASMVKRSETALHLAHAVAGTKAIEYRVSARGLRNARGPPASPLDLTGWRGSCQWGKCGAGGRTDGLRLTLFLGARGARKRRDHRERTARGVAQKVESNVINDAICVAGDH